MYCAAAFLRSMGSALESFSAILADINRRVRDLIAGSSRRARHADILFLSAEVQNRHERERNNPEKQLDWHPPPADENPPEETVLLLLQLERRLAVGFRAAILLKCLGIKFCASAIWANHLSHRPYSAG